MSPLSPRARLSPTVSITHLPSNQGPSRSSPVTPAAAAQAFNHFDEDGSGTIDVDEIVHAMTKIGQKLTRKQAEDFVKAADVDGDGEIDYEEFVNILTSGRH